MHSAARILAAASIAAIAAAPALAQSGGAPARAPQSAEAPPPFGFSGAYLSGRYAANRSDVDRAGRMLTRALALDPENMRLAEQAVIYQAAAGRVSDAARIALRLAEADPDHRVANLILTVEDIAEGAYLSARSRIERSPGSYHPLIGALLAAWSAEGLGERDFSAIDALGDRAIFRLFGNYQRGLILAAAGEDDAALAAFEKSAAELTAPSGRIALAYGAALRKAGRPDEARAVYEAAMGVTLSAATLEAALDELDAGAPAALLVSTPQEGAAEALFGLASALSQDGEPRLGLLYTRLALHLRPDFGAAALLAAETLDGQGQHALAVAAYEKIGVDSPLNRAAEIGRAESLYKMEQADKAAEALRALIRRAPEAADAHIALGDLMRRMERFEEGAEAYDAAIRLFEAQGRENWVLFYQRGICYERADQWDLAEADFFKALELRPDQPLVLNYLGYSWLDKGLKVEEALDLIRKAVEQRPEDGYIVDSLGWGYYLMGDFEAAVRELERAVELRPVDPVINDHLGDALWRVGRKREAEFQWRRALSFDPEERELKRISRKLKVGLDVVLREEAEAEGAPSDAAANDG